MVMLALYTYEESHCFIYILFEERIGIAVLYQIFNCFFYILQPRGNTIHMLFLENTFATD